MSYCVAHYFKDMSKPKEKPMYGQNKNLHRIQVYLTDEQFFKWNLDRPNQDNSASTSVRSLIVWYNSLDSLYKAEIRDLCEDVDEAIPETPMQVQDPKISKQIMQELERSMDLHDQGK